MIELGNTVCSQSSIGKYAFMDLSAMVCDLTSIIHDSSDIVQWNTPRLDVPLPLVYAYDKINDKAKWNKVLEDDPNIKKSHFTARVASVVTSAIQSLVPIKIVTYSLTHPLTHFCR